MSQIIEVLGPMTELDCARQYKFKNRVMKMHTSSQGSSLRSIVHSEDQACDLLSKLLIYNPDHRVSAAEAPRHSYFNERPICVMNITGRIPPDEWNTLATIGGRTSEN
jgi:serine/threonine protein kinase